MATDLADRPYIKYTPDIEKKQPNEDEDIQAIAGMINVIQKAQWNMHRHCYSGELAQSLACSSPVNPLQALTLAPKA